MDVCEFNHQYQVYLSALDLVHDLHVCPLDVLGALRFCSSVVVACEKVAPAHHVDDRESCSSGASASSR